MFEKERPDLAAYLNDYTEKEKKEQRTILLSILIHFLPQKS